MPREHPLILPLGYSEAAMFLRSKEGRRVEAILSIHGTEECGVEALFDHRIDLAFDDIAAPDPADRIAAYHARMRQRVNLENGRDLRPPTREHAAAIIAFARDTQHLQGIVLCHCLAGISRSPAAALLCLATWKPPGQERECMEELLRVRSCALSHTDLLRFGDELLNRNGKLIEATRS